MIQTNVRTKSEREVKRIETTTDATTKINLDEYNLSAVAIERLEKLKDVKAFLVSKGLMPESEFQAAKTSSVGSHLPLSAFTRGALVTINVGNFAGSTGEVVALVPPRFGQGGKVTVRGHDSKRRKFSPSDLSLGGIGEGSQLIISSKRGLKVLDEHVPHFPNGESVLSSCTALPHIHIDS